MELISSEYWFQYKFNKRTLESKIYLELFLIMCLSIYIYEVKDLWMVSNEKLIIAKVIMIAMLLAVTFSLIIWKTLRIFVFTLVDKFLLVLLSVFSCFIMGYILLGTIMFLVSVYFLRKNKHMYLEKFSKWDFQKSHVRQKNLIAKSAIPFILLFDFTIGFNEFFLIVVFILALNYVLIWSASYPYSFNEYLREQKKTIEEMDIGLRLYENQHGKINIRKKIKNLY